MTPKTPSHEPRHMLEIDRIYHADAFDLLPKVDDDSVDLIICDGPYGVTANARLAAVVLH